MTFQKKNQGGLKTRNLVKKSYPNRPLITVVTAVYNGQEYLEQTIQSVFNQNYDNVEYIVVDGGSTDQTLEIIQRYESTLDYWLSEPDEGVYYAMNKGIMLANGELIVLLNADDFFHEDSLSRVVEMFMLNQKKEAIYYGNAYILYEDLQTTSLRKANLNFKKCMGVIHQTMFVSKEVYKKHGLYDLKYSNAADYDFAIKTFLKHVPYIYIDHPMAYSRRREGRISEKFAKRSMAEEYEIFKVNYGFLGYVYFYRNFLFSKFREITHKTIVLLFGEKVWVWVKRTFIIHLKP